MYESSASSVILGTFQGPSDLCSGKKKRNFGAYGLGFDPQRDSFFEMCKKLTLRFYGSSKSVQATLVPSRSKARELGTENVGSNPGTFFAS